MKRLMTIRNMFAAVVAVLLKFVLKWTGYPAIEDVKTRFEEYIIKIDGYIEIQKAILTGYTQEKKAKRIASTDFAMLIGKKVRAWASETGNSGLAGALRISRSKMLYGKAINAVAFANIIKDAIAGMTAADKTKYEITDAEILDYQKAIDDFTEVLTLPRDKVVARANAIKRIKEFIREASLLLVNELDGLMEKYRGEDFYSEYFIARKIIDMIRHTVVEGNVTNEVGADLKKVKITFKGKDKETGEEKVAYEEMTDKDGNFKQSELNPELEWDVTFELPEHESKTVSDIELSPGEHEKLEIVLNKLP